MSGAQLKMKPDNPKSAPKARSVIPPKLPGILRKNHKALFAGLREIATETHTLHRLWYKNHLQFRHMVWWRKLHGVRQMGMYIATGPLHDTVPSAGNLSESTRAHATESGEVILDEDAHILGAQFLSSLALAYTTLWGQSTEDWARVPIEPF
ncbi:hypothetical protein MYAM1_001100 [Malassezia yamatoensis]|uniref:Uncharacterized protein n=1 Tax=Malassezia yamatoensis TaxID=253288 RepID=A0AAJ5YPW0_9BASI|nr:hypothetical protein MYAM1_001100 [Malassezia yamatoensis]